MKAILFPSSFSEGSKTGTAKESFVAAFKGNLIITEEGSDEDGEFFDAL
jgi:hypothetical protein